MAKLSNLSIQTLRYYDRIDLFKPIEIDPKNQYRYYQSNQLYYLDLIKALKYLGLSLDEVKSVLTLSPSECNRQVKTYSFCSFEMNTFA